MTILQIIDQFYSLFENAENLKTRFTSDSAKNPPFSFVLLSRDDRGNKTDTRAPVRPIHLDEHLSSKLNIFLPIMIIAEGKACNGHETRLWKNKYKIWILLSCLRKYTFKKYI